MPSVEILGSLPLPFREQIAALKTRTQNPLTQAQLDAHGADLSSAAHLKAFTIAGAAKADMLAQFAQAVQGYAESGKTLQEFRKDFDRIRAESGWEHTGGRNWRSRVIYQTNVATSYQTGRLAQLRDPELQQAAPYWMYHLGASANHRPEHAKLKGLVLPADSPRWAEIYPNPGKDFGCRCYVQAVSAAQAKAAGATIAEPPPTAETGKAETQSDWTAKTAIAATAASMAEFARGKLEALPAQLGAAVWRSLPAEVRLVSDKEYADWADARFAGRAAKHSEKDAVMIGTLPEEALARMAALKLPELHTAAIVMRELDLWHLTRTKKVKPLPLEIVKQLPALLRESRIYWDNKEGGLIYLLPGAAGKAIVLTNYTGEINSLSGKRKSFVANFLHTAAKLGRVEIKDFSTARYQLLSDGKKP